MSNRPNVILITTDHQRYDCVGAHGNPHIRTPNLDRMVAEGVSLQNCFVQSPVCMPSRASIWCGRYPQNHRVTTNGIALPRSEITLAHAFQNGGYHTCNIGKLHFLPHFGRDHARNEIDYAGYGYERNLLSDEPGCYPDAYVQWVEKNAPQYLDALRVPLPTGARGHFDEWVLNAPEKFSHPAWIGSEARTFLQCYRDQRPFFMTLGFYAPHPPLNPPQEFVDLYDPQSLPLPVIHPSERAKSRYQNITQERWRQMKAYFYAMCSHVDYHLGLLFETLKATGLDQNTIVVFMSDHGDALGDHGQLAKGPSSLDSMIHIPLLVRAPGILPRGRKVDGLIEAIDLFPTLCGLSRVPVPKGVKGSDFSTVLKGESKEAREDVLVEYKDSRSGFSVKAVRNREYKYFHYQDGREALFTVQGEDPEVFDLKDEPVHRAALQHMRQRMLTRLIEAEDDLPVRTHDY